MSRTYRAPLRFIEQNEESYIKHKLGYFRRHGHWLSRRVRRRKTEERYQADIQEAQKEYEEALKTASFDKDGNPYSGFRWGYDRCTLKRTMVPNYIHLRSVSRYYYTERDWSIEEEIESLREEYSRFTRDGHWSETARKSGFKKASAKTTRRNNRRLEHSIVKGDDYDHLPYPDQHDGDYLGWSFW